MRIKSLVPIDSLLGILAYPSDDDGGSVDSFRVIALAIVEHSPDWGNDEIVPVVLTEDGFEIDAAGEFAIEHRDDYDADRRMFLLRRAQRKADEEGIADP